MAAAVFTVGKSPHCASGSKCLEGNLMGLESVEILLQLDEVFGIQIPDDLARTLRTPADLIALIMRRIPTVNSPVCLSQQLFYKLRRSFRAQIPAFVGHFEPNTQLSTLLQKQQWQSIWSALRQSLGDPRMPTTVLWPGAFRDGPKSIQQLIWHLITSMPKPDTRFGECWNRARVEAEVHKIVMSVLGAQNYRRSASFVDDLGMG
jgi:hypothetical protein